MTKDHDKAILYRAFLSLKSQEECHAFLKDLCTPAELKALSERLKVAKILFSTKKSYRDIHADTGISLATIGRVARFLTHESYQGYRTVLERLEHQSDKESS